MSLAGGFSEGVADTTSDAASQTELHKMFRFAQTEQTHDAAAS